MSDPLALDEAEHQALDLLDELPLGSLWIRAQTAKDAVSDPNQRRARAELEAKLSASGESVAEVDAAEGLASTALRRLVARVAEAIVDAGFSLSETQARGDLDRAALEQLREQLNTRTDLALAIGPAVETTRAILGLAHDSIAWALLLALAEAAEAELPAQLRPCAAALAERLAAAQPPASADAPAPVDLGLPVYRSAAVVLAGPSIRARALAADHPEHLALAQRLVGDPQFVGPEAKAAELVACFDRARAALEQGGSADAEDPSQLIDGPKRKFTSVHLILALIVLGLTLWHYVFR